MLKTAVDATTLAPAIRREIQAGDADHPVIAVTSLDQMVESSSALTRVQTLLLGVLAGLALLLAVVGLYGVMAYSVAQRTQEIGVRMALGAHRPSVLFMILRQALVLIGVGLAIGVAGAIVLGRVLSTTLEPMLFQVSPSDVMTFVVVPVMLGIVGIVASLIPARRATMVDPIEALRNT